MKNLHKLLLLPISILLMSGCSCSIMDDIAKKALIEEATNLEFDEKYKEENLKYPATDVDTSDLFETIYDNAFKKVLSIQYAEVYHGVSFQDVDNPYTETITCSLNDYYLNNGFTMNQDFSVTKGNEVSKDVIIYSYNSKKDYFYDNKEEAIVKHVNSGFYGESIEIEKLKGKSADQKEEAFFNLFYYTSLGEINGYYPDELYRTEDGYIYYLEFVEVGYEYHLVEPTNMNIIENNYQQYIFTLDKDFKLLKATVFKKTENDIGPNNVHTGVFKTVNLNKGVYYFNYGERENHNDEFAKITNRYSTPYFDYSQGWIYLESINDDAPAYDSIERVRCIDNKTIRLELALWFADLTDKNIEITVEAYAIPYSSLYGNLPLTQVSGKGPFEVKNHSDKLSFDDETKTTTVKMDSLDDCLLFSIELHLNEENQGLVQNGTVEIQAKNVLRGRGFEIPF